VPFTNADEHAVAVYAEEPSNFDGDDFRRSVWRISNGIRKHYILAGKNHLFTVGLQEPNKATLQAMANVLSAMERAYTIHWFMSDSKRVFPESGRIVGPTNVNGGYCRACMPGTIVIYRKEDALRVLIHELQHAGCLDDHSAAIAHLEARTEAWAELIYAMVGAVVHRLRPEVAWSIQTAWSVAQNRRLRSEFGVTGPTAYAWRYTVGKEDVWQKMGLPIALRTGSDTVHFSTPPGQVTDSLQLGAPKLDIQ
jgi:hypothetical protein